ADHAAVLAGRDPYARSIAVMGDHPVGAEVDPAAVRVAHDHNAVGADVATPILLVDLRHRELEQVDGRIAIDVLEDRPVLDLDRRDQPEAALHPVPVSLYENGLILRARKAQRTSQPPARCWQARHDPPGPG